MSKVFKVGLIGCGHIAETYFSAHKYFNNFKIIKCADIKEEVSKKGAPSRLEQESIHKPGGSRRSSLACALYRQETVVRAAVEALFEIFVRTKWTELKIGVKN